MNQLLSYITHFGFLILQIILVIFVIKAIFSSSIKEYHSNWNTLIDDFNFSTKEFYELLTQELISNGIKNLKTSQIYLKEGGTLSTRRLYLRLVWKDYQYDICAAPFGKGFFISWWLMYKNSVGHILVSKIPFIGSWLSKVFYPLTYYKIDTASMFMSYAQSSVLKVLDDLTKDKGVRSLSEDERKPIMRDIFKR